MVMNVDVTNHALWEWEEDFAHHCSVARADFFRSGRTREYIPPFLAHWTYSRIEEAEFTFLGRFDSQSKLGLLTYINLF